MSIEEKTELVKKVLASGLDVLEFLAEDAVWVIPGFGTYRGKQDVYTKLLAPTHALMESMGRSVITARIEAHRRTSSSHLGPPGALTTQDNYCCP